jgi:hypothetical protein
MLLEVLWLTVLGFKIVPLTVLTRMLICVLLVHSARAYHELALCSENLFFYEELVNCVKGDDDFGITLLRG